MHKLSRAQMTEMLKDASSTLRKLSAENAVLQEKVAAFELRGRAAKIASSMHEKGIRSDTPYSELVENLEKEAAAGQLDAIERAVDLVGPDMGKFAQVNMNNDERNSPYSSSDFERYIVGTAG